MTSESLHQNAEKFPWFIWQISALSVACLYCVLFLGLKLKWFRAQLRMGDVNLGTTKREPVQGVGFKLRTTSENDATYKVTSEFATPVPTKENPKSAREKNPNETFTTPNISHKGNSTNNATSVIKSPIHPKATAQPKTGTSQHVQKTATVPKSSTKFPAPKIPSSNTTLPKNILKTPAQNVNVNSPTPVKNEKPGISELKAKDSFKKHRKVSEPLNTTPRKVEDPPEERHFQKKNPVKKPSVADHENWNIQEQKPKIQLNGGSTLDETLNLRNNLSGDYENWNVHEEKIRNPLANSAKNEEPINSDSYFSAGSSMYSSQAASIFFGGGAPTPPPRSAQATLKGDDSDTESQTSA